MNPVLLVMSSAQPGREADYQDWYVGRHLLDMKAVPGVADGRFYRLTTGAGDTRWLHAARYELDRPLADVLPTVFARAGKAEMPLTDAIEPASVLMLSAAPRRPRALAEDAARDADGDLFVVLSNPSAGQDEAYNAWYDERHVPDVIATPGILAGQRFALAPETAGRTSAWAYAALYDVAAGFGPAAVDGLRERAGGPQMPLSPALDMESLYTGLFERVA